MALYLSGTAATRMMGVFSTCWTMILKGNIELSIVMSIILIICSSIIDSEWLFYTAEQLFNPNNTMEEQGIDLSWYYIGWAICTTIVPFLIGIFAQNICLRLKKPARIFIRRAIYSYILINVIIMTVYTVAKWLQAEHSLRVNELQIRNVFFFETSNQCSFLVVPCAGVLFANPTIFNWIPFGNATSTKPQRLPCNRY